MQLLKKYILLKKFTKHFHLKYIIYYFVNNREEKELANSMGRKYREAWEKSRLLFYNKVHKYYRGFKNVV